jgi:hypothetical protein
MKTKFLIQIPLFLLLVTLIACQSEEPNPNSFPEIGETSGNYIAFRFDGNEFVTESFSSTWTAPKEDPYRGTFFEENGKSILGKNRTYGDTIPDVTFSIKLEANPILNVPIALGLDNSENSVETPFGSNLKFTYQTTKGYLLDTLKGPESSPLWYVTAGSSYDFRTNNIQRGEIMFALIDTANQIYQGTFWADVKFHKNKYYGSSLYPQPTNEQYWNLVGLRTSIDTERVIRIRDGRFYFNAAKPDLRHRAEL